ncbi:MAG: orotate phosphoribosyltransferase, partial [Crenarchaeota archaeon]|nr:orotate phosphoribosyltransferase [Thermoproteota archaeon]
MKENVKNTIIEMYRHGIIKFGDFILTSGKKSPYYIDLRELPSYPELYRKIMLSIASDISLLEYDIIAGI